jgi:pimeloyl-ACP methyl ester carboxylesterase
MPASPARRARAAAVRKPADRAAQPPAAAPKHTADGEQAQQAAARAGFDLPFDIDAVRAPGAVRIALEARAPWEFGAALASWPMLRALGAWPEGDGHEVIVFPGLAAGDLSTQPLRAFLSERGFRPQGWYLGLNRGPRDGVEALMALLERQLDEACQRSGRRVSLIGWSLGGIYARELAKARPEQVRAVVTLGTPFALSPRATNAWRVYEWLSGDRVHHPVRERGLDRPPPVPTTSVLSKSDGVVAWQCSVQQPHDAHPHTENVEVRASHIGLGLNPAAWYLLAERLAQPEGQWARFAPSGLARLLFRSL